MGDVETGSRAAAPIWVDFMKEATASMPIMPFEQPDDINMVKINPDSGLLACDPGDKGIFEYYKPGTEPTQCHRAIASPNRKEMESLDNLNNLSKKANPNEFIEEL